jgi:hypothetical protein
MRPGMPKKVKPARKVPIVVKASYDLMAGPPIKTRPVCPPLFLPGAGTDLVGPSKRP